MSKFVVEVKKFLKDMKYAGVGAAAFALSVFLVDYYGTDSIVTKGLGILWALALLAAILLFSGLGSPVRNLISKLFKLDKKKNENISNKKE